MSRNFTRRDFVNSSLSGLILTSLPMQRAFVQTTFKQRLDWDTFKAGKDYASFLDAIGKMRANTNASDKRSWRYWTNVHINNCPHGIPYFLAWHRGYLNYFEQQLRAVSGNLTLTLPYWEYYKNPKIPAEFTNPASWNPLYVQRVNTDVTPALTLVPFSNNLTNMQRGLVNAFEPSLESMPHNPIHDIIGGIMADMESPMDPIFWLHHANIDRLWSAWIAAGNGRIMPPRTDSYWNGNFTYATQLTLGRIRTIDTRSDLGYFYQNESMPAILPTFALAEPIQLAMEGTTEDLAMLGTPGASGTNRPLRRPPLGNFPLSGIRSTGVKRLSIGGARKLSLNETSISARVPIETQASQIVKLIFKKLEASPFGRVDDSLGPYTSIQIILDNVTLTSTGITGGYFYKIYLNLPPSDDAADTEEKYWLGNVGPFQLSAAKHHHHGAGVSGVRLVFPATKLLKNLTGEELTEVTVSFVRQNGNNSPAGEVIAIGECRIEVSTDDLE